MTEDEFLHPDQALTTILESVLMIERNWEYLTDCLGRILAEDIYAGEDIPGYDSATMDGFAITAADSKGADVRPCELRVVAEQPVGKVRSTSVGSGDAVWIMTGAPIPTGANAVVIREDAISEDVKVTIRSEVVEGDNVRHSGEDVKREELVMCQGTRIGPAELGMLAALGYETVPVYRRPRVAIITTGDEIIDVSERPEIGQVRDVNHYSLLGQVLSCGATVSMTERMPDEHSALERVLAIAVDASDVIITSGGVSAGKYDTVRGVLHELGELGFWRVAVKPGNPFTYGHLARKPFFGLSGNPVSSLVAFDLFVRPALRRMAGEVEVRWPIVSGILLDDLQHTPGVREFVCARVRWDDARNTYIVTSTGAQGSDRLSSILGANCYAILPAECSDAKAGEQVSIMLLG